jgi:hypothetical protein
MAKTKFKIDYTWDKKQLVDRTEATLLNEGWKKTNYTIPGDESRIKPNEIYTTWFERVWE